jgi:hypothetical protein
MPWSQHTSCQLVLVELLLFLWREVYKSKAFLCVIESDFVVGREQNNLENVVSSETMDK